MHSWSLRAPFFYHLVLVFHSFTQRVQLWFGAMGVRYELITHVLHLLLFFPSSYGKSWGDEGYINIHRNLNMCGISTDAGLPII